MSARVAAVAFDSPDFAMVERGLEDGSLPNLAALLERGRLLLLRENQEVVTSTSVVTMVHGCGPEEHRLFYPTQLAPGTHTLAPVSGDASRRPPFWRYLSDAGLRSVVVSPYGVGLVEELRGVQVIGWGSHDAYARSRWRSTPPDLARRLEHEFGPRTLRYGEPPPIGDDGYRDYIARMVLGTEQQARAMASLMRSEQWDFFFGSFADCHQAGHYLWHLANPGGDDPGPPPPDLADGLAAVYRAVDTGLGMLLEAAPPDTTIMVASSSSMGPHHRLGEAVEAVLECAGLLVRGSGATPPRLRALGLARRAIQASVPAAARPFLARFVPRDRLVSELSLADVDWSRTRAFQLPSDGSAAIRLNLAGREPGGTVSTGREYDRACEELIELFRGLTVADSGEPAVVDAVRFDELTGAPVEGALPDICVRWARLRDVHALEAPGLGTIHFESQDPRKSLHWEPGFLALEGPGVPASGQRSAVGEGRLIDFGATVLALLGVEPPAHMKGESLLPATALR